MKLVYVPGRENVLPDFVSRNIKERPSWRVIKCDSVEFNNLRYTENGIKTFQCADEVLRKLIEIKEKETKPQQIYQVIFQNTFITFIIYHIIFIIYIYHIISVISYISYHNILYYQHNRKHLIILPIEI